MKKFLLLVCAFITLHAALYAQCTTTNAVGCNCPDGTQNCDLLPNITVADEPLLVNGPSGIIEYSQMGNGVDNGRLRISVSTPNIGHGPLTIRASNTYICGLDTFFSNPGTCPDGSSPHNLVYQRVYHKNGSAMTYYDRPAGSMTYHPTHNHMHVDDWSYYTLRIRDTSEANPLNWQVVGNGSKLGFCLMDYGTCTYYNGHCQDSMGNILLNADLPNFGLGGGQYACSAVEQGISSGYTDIYYQYLDGMWIDVPANTCNGDYYIVVEVDPLHHFLEERTGDNVVAVPVTLTKQLPTGAGAALITTGNNTDKFCEGATLVLTANPAATYLWNTGDTTQSIAISQAGTYSVDVNSVCGSASSQPLSISRVAVHVNSVLGDTACEGTPITLSATGTGSLVWYTDSIGGTPQYSGNAYTFTAQQSGNYFVEAHDTVWGLNGYVGPADNAIGAGGYFYNDQHMLFSVYKPAILKSVKVYADSAGTRTIELRNATGTVIQTKTLSIPQGEQTVLLDFDVPTGANYQLGWPVGSSPGYYRNSSGAAYPYNFNGLISITGNSANDTARYYCFYHWQVMEQPFTCAADRTPVYASVDTAIATSLSSLNAQYLDNDPAVTLSGSPAGGTFSGPGINGSTFTPADAGIGGPYVISYSVLGANGCYGISSDTVSVLNHLGIAGINGLQSLRLSPNPSNGSFNIEASADDPLLLSLQITDLLGRRVYSTADWQVSSNAVLSLNLQNLAKGMYQLTLRSGSEHQALKIVIQ